MKLIFLLWVLQAFPPVGVQPVVRTAQVTDDPDDPAVWINRADPARSLIVGTNKVKAPTGALVVFNLDGTIKQTVAELDRPNNVDIEYGLGAIDIAVTAERLKQQLRIFSISEKGLADVTSEGNTKVSPGREGEQAAPMGVSLYKRQRDGAIFAIVAPKNGPAEGYLSQYRLESDGKGKIKSTFIRYFGKFSGTGEIEAVAVDDALGFIYYADEGNGIHKYHADPDRADANKEIAHFGKTGFKGDREGIAIYARPDGTGYVVCTDQLAGNSEYHVFKREGDQSTELGIVSGGADTTDGLEITSRSLGPKFPKGMMIAMNSNGRNFLVYRWEDVERAILRR